MKAIAIRFARSRPAEENLRLFLRDDAGEILGQFSSIEANLPEGQTLSFGMNAGMYHLDRRPVGLYLEEGEQESKLYPNSGPGNFGLVPNGVLCIRSARADVIESLAYQAENTRLHLCHAIRSHAGD